MELNVGIVQVKPIEDMNANSDFAFRNIHRLACEGAHVIVLPEMWPYPYHPEQFVHDAQERGGPLWQRLSEVAAREGIWLIAGSVARLCGGKVYNTCYIFDDRGVQVAEYSKIHLFDVDVEGVVRSRESSVLTPGDRVTTFDTPWGTFGVCICFDMRFNGLFDAMVRRGVRVIFCPSAFSRSTGVMHWELTMRMRALDTQAFMVGCDAGFDPEGEYASYGHSMVCDPWGSVVFEAGEDAEAKIVVLDLDMIDRIRAELPLISARRDDLYRLDEGPRA